MGSTAAAESGVARARTLCGTERRQRRKSFFLKGTGAEVLGPNTLLSFPTAPLR